MRSVARSGQSRSTHNTLRFASQMIFARICVYQRFASINQPMILQLKLEMKIILVVMYHGIPSTQRCGCMYIPKALTAVPVLYAWKGDGAFFFGVQTQTAIFLDFRHFKIQFRKTVVCFISGERGLFALSHTKIIKNYSSKRRYIIHTNMSFFG
jgi:hypothetical protein